MSHVSSFFRMLWIALLAAALMSGLQACSDGTSNASSTPVPLPTPASPTTVPVSGTVATGAPVPGASVSLLCAAGGSVLNATADATGHYDMTVADSCAAPFMLKATGSVDGVTVTLYAFADAAGNINITPLTHIAAGIAAGGDPALEFAAVLAATRRVSDTWGSASASNARSQLAAKLTEMGLSISGLSDLLHPRFNARSGDPIDDLLESLKTRRGGVTLNSLVEQVVREGGSPLLNPWDMLFPRGVQTLVLTARDCSLETSWTEPSFPPSATLTVSRSAGYFSIATQVQGSTVTFAPVRVGPGKFALDTDIVRELGQVSDAIYRARVSSALLPVELMIREALPDLSSRYVTLLPRASETPAAVPSNGLQSLLVNQTGHGQLRKLSCDNIDTPLRRTAMPAFDLNARVSAMVTTASAVISTLTSQVTACNDRSTTPAGTYTFGFSAAGNLSYNGKALPAGWFTSADHADAMYFDLITWREGPIQSALTYVGFHGSSRGARLRIGGGSPPAVFCGDLV